jgi:hypothetical protein
MGDGQSRAVYPTQAKERLEWGTQPLLLVHRKLEVVTTRLSHPLLLPEQRVGAPFKPFFGLSGIHSSRPGVVDGTRQHNERDPVKPSNNRKVTNV